MAISWGAFNGTLRVGIEVTVSGTTATVKYYVGTSSVGAFEDNQVMTYTGSITGSTSFYNSLPNNGTQLVSTKTRSVAAGTSYTFAASISGAYNGATPSHSVAYAVPVAVPSAPTAPALSAVTASGMTLSWTQPANWGGNDTDDYEVAYSKDPAFPAGATSYITVLNATSAALTGLDSSELYYARVKAKNSAGFGPYSATVSATTLASTSSPPLNLTISNIGPASARATWAAPLDDGGSAITSYELQYATDSFFTNATTITGITVLTRDVTGLTPKTLYYIRVRAKNAIGVGAWTAAQSFTTLAGAKISSGGTFIDVPTFVKVAGVMTPVAPQKRVAGAWVY